MSDIITPSQMYCALLKAAATVKEEAQIKCPSFKVCVRTERGDEESMCERGEIIKKCEWPYGCPLIAKEAK